MGGWLFGGMERDRGSTEANRKGFDLITSVSPDVGHILDHGNHTAHTSADGHVSQAPNGDTGTGRL